jgi:hypothetical protein
MVNATKLAMKYCIKDITGIQNADNSDYKLSFNDKGLSDECIDDLINCELSSQISLVTTSFVNGIPTKILNPDNTEAENVEILGLGK